MPTKTLEMTDEQRAAYKQLMDDITQGIINFTEKAMPDMDFLVMGTLNALVYQLRSTTFASAKVMNGHYGAALIEVASMIAMSDAQFDAKHGKTAGLKKDLY